jgi:putative oxidoreductase
MSRLQSAFGLGDRLANRAQKATPVALLLLRVCLAAVFIPSGWGKLHDLAKVTAFFTELGIPAPHLNAVVVAISELGCGTLLLLGLLARAAALPLVASMAVAIITAKRADIAGVADLFALDEFIYVAMAFAVATLGPGRFALDALARRLVAAHMRSQSHSAASV